MGDEAIKMYWAKMFRLSSMDNRKLLMNAEHMSDIIKVMGSFTPLFPSHYSNISFPHSQCGFH